ncbi:hypothetical protein A7X67_09275 [Clostridium sp. W14A]|nr:hypothetical protein A7X67_09275 [Clostridium sp. W14A]
MKHTLSSKPDGASVNRRKRTDPAVWLFLILITFTAAAAICPVSVWSLLWQAVKARLFLSGMLLLFCLTALSLIWKKFQRIDERIFELFNFQGQRPRWLDRLMLAFTQLGNGLFAAAAALLFYLLGRRLLGYELILGNLALWLVVELIKMAVDRSRPYQTIQKIRIVGVREKGASFPSGHTSQAFFMAALLSHYFNLGTGQVRLLYLVALCVGMTRMYVGMHYPRDVIGGAILGTCWGLLGITVNQYILSQPFSALWKIFGQGL